MKNWYVLGAVDRRNLAVQLNRCEEFGMTVHAIFSTSTGQGDIGYTVVAWKSDSRKPPLLTSSQHLLDFADVHGPS
jgi:hypothetical protein